MKFQNYMCLLLIFLICMISISAASAADDSANDIIGTNTNDNLIIEETINEDVSIANDNTDQISEESDEIDLDDVGDKPTLKQGETTTGSFTDLNRTINNNSNNKIVLNQDYTFNFDGADDSPFSSGINISRKLTIDGQGHKINGSDNARIFNIIGSDVTLQNITFLNGKSFNGGAIYGNCTIADAYFKHNEATNNGGAIYGNCNISNTQFSENYASNYGGAIYGDCNISDSSLNGNHLTNTGNGACGGAIYGNCNINNTQFLANYGAYYGGAIYGYCTIIESDFSQNNAKIGGALFGSGTIKNANFYKNYAEYYGGAINGSYTINNANFTNNSATHVGAAIHGGCNINNSRFINHQADESGGAIFTKDDCTISNSQFINNQAFCASVDAIEKGGGAVYCKNGVITNCSFYENKLHGDYGLLNKGGGALHFEENGYVYSSIFVENSADAHGGAIWTNKITVSDCIFINNTSPNDDIISNQSIGAIVGTNNWFGNNATNYNKKPSQHENFTGDSWLFLNATATPNSIPKDESTNIAFKLFIYNSTTQKISEYDNNLLPEFYLTVQATKGTLNKNTIKLGNSVKFTANDGGDGIVTAKHNISEQNVFVTQRIIIKIAPHQTKIVPKTKTVELFIGNKTKIGYSLSPSNAVGEVSFTSSNPKIVSVNSKTGEITALAAGTATITIKFSGNEKYASSNTTVKVTVKKINTKLIATKITTTYNVNKNLVITLKDQTGKPLSGATLTVDLGGSKNYKTDSKGQVKVATGKLVPKTYTAKISYAGNKKYSSSKATAKVTVKKATPKMTAKAKTFKYEDKTKKYSITLKNNKGTVLKNTKVTLKVNGKTYTAKTNSKGVATFKLTKLSKKGTYKAAITYAGNKYYTKLTKNAKLTVKAPAWKTVCRGSKDKAMVKKIQRALKNNGYYISYKNRYLKVDGIFEQYTEMAVKEFQDAKGLKVTGKVDYKTAKKLKIV